jgi:LPS-assembly lipoprotein
MRNDEYGMMNAESNGGRSLFCGDAFEKPSGYMIAGLRWALFRWPRSFIIHHSLFIILTAALLLSGCGFQLRGTAALPFESVYVQAPPASQFAIRLKRVMTSGSQARIVDRPADAQVLLHIQNEQREKQVLSLSGGGRVAEYLLRYRVFFRLTDNKSAQEYVGISEIVLQRDFSYDDSRALAKEAEEALLYRDMENDAVQQLVRRLQVARVTAKS